jgi:hypothetical protein
MTADLVKAIAYVQDHGSVIERARLAAILQDELPSKTALRELARLQNPDGGFAYWVPQASNLCDTAYVLQWFDDLKVHKGPVVERACRFILDRQQKDGGWDEVAAVVNHDPPEWMMPGRIETRVWLTGFCAHVLICFGHAEAPGTYCPTDFLLEHRDEQGRLAGYPIATWVALPMLHFYPGPDPETFDRARAVAEADYASQYDSAMLAWMLRCLKDADLPFDHPLVARALDDLERQQRPDGSWPAAEGEQRAVEVTVAALRELKRYGRIGQGSNRTGACGG